MADAKKKVEETVYSIKEVAKHDKATDFWTVVDNDVYDLSTFKDRHPGGDFIMNAAGTDATISFHQYHLMNPTLARSVLNNYKIGKLDGATASPVMGGFYKAVCERVRCHLVDKPRRPFFSKLSWFMDAFILTALILSAPFLNAATPLWILIAVHLALPSVSALRMVGQQHANGHLQLWGFRASWWAEVYGYMLGLPAMMVYGLPNSNENQRKLLNEKRSIAQYEFPLARGFSEHVTIHHSWGAALEDDQCFFVVTAMGIFRFSSIQPHKMHHYIQTWFLFQLGINMIGEAAELTKLSLLWVRLVYIIKYLFPTGDIVRGCAMLVGIFTPLLASWCYLALPCSGSVGFTVYVLLSIIRESFHLYPIHAFFAQHAWDKIVTESEIKTDWGKYTAETCFSWWPKYDFAHIFLWGSPNGAVASTLTYHLEHHLFPGLNYFYLAEIAPIVQECCKEYGVTYNRLDGGMQVLRARHSLMKKYARPKSS